MLLKVEFLPILNCFLFLFDESTDIRKKQLRCKKYLKFAGIATLIEASEAWWQSYTIYFSRGRAFDHEVLQSYDGTLVTEVPSPYDLSCFGTYSYSKWIKLSFNHDEKMHNDKQIN